MVMGLNLGEPKLLLFLLILFWYECEGARETLAKGAPKGAGKSN